VAKILIADDSLFQRLVLSKIVKSQQYDFIEAKNGLEALDILRSHKPDLALLDLNMPELSGLEVLEAASQEGLETDIVVITADIQETTRERCFALGARKILSKPPKEQEVLDALNQLISKN
jgi:twitching motility two-component system response regulator PilH